MKTGHLYLLSSCFFLSGLAGLIYQTAWSQQLALVFGTSEQALVAVLAAYMGGLALGAALAGRWVRRVRRTKMSRVHNRCRSDLPPILGRLSAGRSKR